MLTSILTTLFNRDLAKLRQEITLYQNEHAIWRTDKAITNSAGNLCLHLIGNLNGYIGAVLGNSGYTRQRDLEFSQKDIPRQELLGMIDQTIEVVQRVLKNMDGQEMEKAFPVLVFKEKTNTGYMLVHLATHLGYHLGQVNYHRRLLDN